MESLEIQEKIKDLKLTEAMIRQMTQEDAANWFRVLGIDVGIKSDRKQRLQNDKFKSKY